MMLYGVWNGRKYPVEGESGVYVCAEHRLDSKVSDILTDHGWSQICQGFRMAGKIEPTRELTRLRFLPILKL